MSGTDYANSSTGVAFENGLVGTMKQSIKINEHQHQQQQQQSHKYEEKENQNELVTNQKITEKVDIVSSLTRKMANQTPTAVQATDNGGGGDLERICLIGSVAADESTVTAAEKFNVPVITSDTGIELASDTQWTTYFVMKEFEGEHFNVIRKTKHRIYGPTALQQIAEAGKGLVYVNRPLYNFSMRGVITCFTGIRKKDELTRLVNLIHTMGGSIRKDMKENSRCTHLICSASAGEKYHYAKTFNLTIVRAAWIYAAWEQRDDPNFFANENDFCESYKLKQFEGLRICLYGFSPEDYQEMVDIMKGNGGIPTDIDDPECTHLILANNISHFPELLTGPMSPPIIAPPPLPAPAPPSAAAGSSASFAYDKIQPPEGLDQLNLNDTNVQNIMSSNNQPIITDTPKKLIRVHNMRSDGVILPGNEENLFLEPANLSPILHNIEEEEENETQANADDKEMSKRKRDSFDNISIISTDTFAAQFCSAKKPKLIRTGSITRSLRRSMSFAALKNPITNMIRVRRNSIDPNASINSITSMESTFTDSIKRPVKEKLLSLKDRITNSHRLKREFCLTPKTSKKFNSTFIERTDTADDKFALPNEISMLSCRKLINSTMNAADMAEAASETDDTDNHTVVTGEKTIAPKMEKNQQTTGTDVADNSNLTAAQSQPISIVPAENPNDHPKNSIPHIVKSDWFWYTIQKGFASEDEHRFADYFESLANTPGGDRRDSLAGIKYRKRKRFSILGAGKRRSSISDVGLSASGSFLDCTNSPSIIKHDSKDFDCSMDNTPKTKKQKSMRFNHFMDLYSTESNYVGILHTIVSEFQKPLDDMVDTVEELLNKSELRSIFNNFSPIYEVHLQMLNHLKELQSNWTDTCLIGKIILDHRDALRKAYPPYVNFFEQMKDTLQQCIAQNPKFHAFLKINQSKPECGRQTLQDLMIRPVQRLPSMSLLIKDILKNTPKSNPDNKVLKEALNAIKDVMTYINEDKRKTEGRVALFDIFNDIDNCPADLVSSHRSYISRCEVSSKRDGSLMIFLFTDYIEICKIRKSKNTNHIKSPTGATNALNTTTRAHTHGKSYKHIQLIPLSAIQYVYDFKDSERAFAISVKDNKDSKDKFYCFNINEDCDKIVYLKNVCKQMAENACRADYEPFLRNCESRDLGIDISDINFGTLKNVFNIVRGLNKTVTRNLSFKTTPLQSKRVVSARSPHYGSTTSLM